mmetsp:Transcript_43473/g.131491  ORF Transcript_43473/g.131491 Transcript_43473/m.131491 type:complete len:261 (+) Transcript_43473:1042-1824(+)
MSCNWWTISMYSPIAPTVLLPSMTSNGSCLHSVDKPLKLASRSVHVPATVSPSLASVTAFWSMCSNAPCTLEIVSLKFLSLTRMPMTEISTTRTMKISKLLDRGRLNTFTLRKPPSAVSVDSTWDLPSRDCLLPGSALPLLGEAAPSTPPGDDTGELAELVTVSVFRCGGVYSQKATMVAKSTAMPRRKTHEVASNVQVRKLCMGGLPKSMLPDGNGFPPSSHLMKRTVALGWKGSGRGPPMHVWGMHRSWPTIDVSSAQ